MESEKVKEIKELFKNCDFTLKHCGNCVLWKDEDCIETIKSKVLTLINELESENERLVESCKNCHYIKDLEIVNGHAKELKDRIAELEEGIAKSMLGCEFLPECTNDKLKQFAERLKEKFNRQEERFATDVTRFENDLDKVKESDLPTAKFLIGKATGQATMAEKAEYYIDETLKEFINNQEYENNTTNIRLETLKDFREKYKEALKEAVKGENVNCFVESLKIFDKTIEEKICDLK